MPIKSKDFVLRHITLTSGDVKGYFDMHREKEARKMFMSHPKTLTESRKEVKEIVLDMRKKKPTIEMLVIDVGGEFAGAVWIDDISYGFAKHKAKIGYGLIKKFRRKGLGTAAIKLATDYAFKKYKLVRMWAYTRTFNKPSARALEKAGYKLEGILRKNKFKGGKYLDDMVWAKVK